MSAFLQAQKIEIIFAKNKRNKVTTTLFVDEAVEERRRPCSINPWFDGSVGVADHDQFAACFEEALKGRLYAWQNEGPEAQGLPARLLKLE